MAINQGMGNYAKIPGGNPAMQALQAQGYRDQTEAKTRADQQYNMQMEATQNQLGAQQRARDSQYSMMGDPNNPRTSNGLEMTISSPGGGGGSSSGSRGGVQIGGGIYPDISSAFAAMQQQAPQVPAPPRVGPPTVPSTSGAFAHAKDVSGRVGNKALEALRNQMTQRGMSDSGMATMGEANILGNVARQQSDAEYQAANIDNTRQWEANQLGYQGDMAQNELGYQGGIQQRGQNMNAFLALLSRLY